MNTDQPKLDVEQAVRILNNDDPKETEQYLLEVNPEAFAQGRIYTTGLAVYNLVEEQLTETTVDDLLAIHDQLKDLTWRRNIRLLAMQRLLDDNKPTEAEEFIVKLDRKFTYQGYRTLLRYYASEGDLKNYRRALKKSDRRKNKNELIRIEREFVSAYSKKMGIEATLTVIDPDKSWLIQEALNAQVGQLPYSEIHTWAETTLTGNETGYVEVHLKALEYELQQGKNNTAHIESLLAYIERIEKGKRIKGSHYTTRQLSLWKFGKLLLNEGLTEPAKQVIKRMSNSSSKKMLKTRLQKMV